MLLEVQIWNNVEDFVLLIIILVGGALVAQLSGVIIRKFFRRTATLLNVNPTNYRFFSYLVTFIIYIIAVLLVIYTVPSLKSLAVTLFASAGIFAAVVGFASQAAFSNIISGLFIAIFKPFRVGDIIKVGTNSSGVVEDITLRHVVIRSWENLRIIIPNTIISNDTITNYSIADRRVCKFMEFGISYDSDVDLAMQIMCEEVAKHPNLIDTRTEEAKEQGKPLVVTRVMSYGDSAVTVRAYAWATDFDHAFDMMTDLNYSIKKRFDEAGIEIPFPHRTIVYKDSKKHETENSTEQPA